MYQQLLMKPASANSVLGKLQRSLLGYGRQGKGFFETTLADGNVTRCISSGRSRRGLYDGKDIRTGNLVSFSNKKTKRKFRPNVIKKRVYSETLDEMIRFHMTTSTLRSIDKAGGLDNYLLTSKHITGKEGIEAKERVLRQMRINEENKLKQSEEAEANVNL